VYWRSTVRGPSGQGVVEDGGGGDGAFGEVAGFLELAEFFPTLDRARDFSQAVGQGEGDLGVFLAALAGEADADEALAAGEDDAAVEVIPGAALVALHHRELDTVDELQHLQREAEFPRHQHVDLPQRHAPGVVAAQGAVPLPSGREVAEEVLRQARVVRKNP
jgi:hypothetical protein